MSRRMLLAMTALPALGAVGGCTEQQSADVLTLILQAAVTALIPILVQLLIGGGTTPIM